MIRTLLHSVMEYFISDGSHAPNLYLQDKKTIDFLIHHFIERTNSSYSRWFQSNYINDDPEEVKER